MITSNGSKCLQSVIIGKISDKRKQKKKIKKLSFVDAKVFLLWGQELPIFFNNLR